MLTEVNFLAVAVAALAPMVIGGIWYGPLFGKLWMSAHGYTPERLEVMKKGMGKAYGLSRLLAMGLSVPPAFVIRSAQSGSYPKDLDQ